METKIGRCECCDYIVEISFYREYMADGSAIERGYCDVCASTFLSHEKNDPIAKSIGYLFNALIDSVYARVAFERILEKQNKLDNEL